MARNRQAIGAGRSPFAALPRCVRGRSTLRALTVLGLLLLLTGCAQVTSGWRIEPDSVSFIESGRTTRAEVLANLGPPLSEYDEERVLVYFWEVTGPTWMTYGIPGHTGALGGGMSWGSFYVVLDPEQRVARSGFLKLDEGLEPGTAVLRFLSE